MGIYETEIGLESQYGTTSNYDDGHMMSILKRGRNTSSSISPLWKIYWMGLVVTLDTNIIIPSLWHLINRHYGASVLVYGLILSVNSISEILGALLFGAWADRRPYKEPIVMALALVSIGSVIFTLSYDWIVWGILIARFIAGACGGATSVLIANVTINTTTQERNQKIGTYWLFALSSNIVGPLISFLGTSLPLKDGMINSLTLPTMISGSFAFLNMLYVIFFWPRGEAINQSRRLIDSKGYERESMFRILLTMVQTTPGVAYVCLYTKLIFTMCVVILQTIATPVAANAGIKETGSSILFVGVGGLILGGVLLAKLFTRWYDDHKILQVGQWMLFFGLFGCIQYFGKNLKHKEMVFMLFLTAMILITVGHSLGITMITSVYSKAIGSQNPHKGMLMGWLIMMGSAGRILAPIFAAIGYSYIGFDTVSISLIVAILLGIILFAKLKRQLYYAQVQQY